MLPVPAAAGKHAQTPFPASPGAPKKEEKRRNSGEKRLKMCRLCRGRRDPCGSGERPGRGRAVSRFGFGTGMRWGCPGVRAWPGGGCPWLSYGTSPGTGPGDPLSPPGAVPAPRLCPRLWAACGAPAPPEGRDETGGTETPLSAPPRGRAGEVPRSLPGPRGSSCLCGALQEPRRQPGQVAAASLTIQICVCLNNF